jgi:uncharacterized protein
VTVPGPPAGKARTVDPRALDVAALCRNGQALEGRWPLATMTRLADGLAGPPGDGDVAWQARGSTVPVAGGEAELWLALEAQAPVLLQCQRCLQPLAETLAVDRRVRFVRGEDEAARLDEESDDDVLALPARLDLHALVEDELILALPLVPRHEVCPEPLPLPKAEPAADAGDAAEAKPNPFAALAALRKRDDA